MRFAPWTWTLTLAGLLAAAPLAAQESSVVTGVELDAALEARAGSVEADRATVRRVLDRAEVAQTAARMGVDVDAAKGAVAALQGEQLTRAAALSASVEQALAGWQMFSINAMTLVLILLLVIIVVLIAE